MIDLFGRNRRRKEAELRERELILAEKQADIADRRLKQQQKIIRMMQEENSKDIGKGVMVPLAAPVLMANVIPEGKSSAVAMDSCGSIYSYASEGVPNFYGTFMGYPAWLQ